MYQSRVFANGDMPLSSLLKKAESTKTDEDTFTLLYNEQRDTIRDFRPDAPTFAHEMPKDTARNSRMALTLRQGGSRYVDVPYRPDLFTGFLDADPRGTVNTPNLTKYNEHSRSRKAHFKLFPDGPDATVEGEKPSSVRNRQRDKSMQITKERLPIFSTSLDYLPGVSRNFITTAGGAALVDKSAAPSIIIDDNTNRAYVSEESYRIGGAMNSVADHPIKIAYYATPHGGVYKSSNEALYDTEVLLSSRDLEQITRALRQKISATRFDTEYERQREIERILAPYQRIEAFQRVDNTVADGRTTYYDRIARALSRNEKMTPLENDTVATQKREESVVARAIRAGAQLVNTTTDALVELKLNSRGSPELLNTSRNTRYEVKDMTTETAKRAASMEVAQLGILNKAFARSRGEFTAADHKAGVETNAFNRTRRTAATTQTEGMKSARLREEVAPIARSRSGVPSSRQSVLNSVEKDNKNSLDF